MKIIFLLVFVHRLHAQLLPNGCPADYSVHLLLRDEDDCGRYYSCSNGFAISMLCPENTLFDENLQVCNWAYEVQCDKSGSSSTTSPTTTEISSTTSTTTEVSSTTSTTTEVSSTTSTTTEVSSTASTTTVSTTTEDQATESTSAQPTSTVEFETTTTTNQPTATPTTTTEINLEPDCTKEHDTNLDDEDCDKYFSCEGGAKLVLTCRSAKLFHFNFKLNYNKEF